MTEEVSVNRL